MSMPDVCVVQRCAVRQSVNPLCRNPQFRPKLTDPQPECFNTPRVTSNMFRLSPKSMVVVDYHGPRIVQRLISGERWKRSAGLRKLLIPKYWKELMKSDIISSVHDHTMKTQMVGPCSVT